MTRLQANVGLVTGFPILETVDQLIKVSARPRNLLASRTKDLREQQVAVTELTALILGVQLSFQQLGTKSVFQKKTVTSSHPDLLEATSTGSPAVGTFSLTPVQEATTHQLLSGGIKSSNAPLGEGELRLRFGGLVDQGRLLDELNGSAGVERGKIRVTDRSGSSAIIDLRFAVTIDDVLRAINEQTSINVTATAVGDRLQLVDNTGLTTANLRVQDVAGGSTAADLGLASIDVAASQAVGQDVVRLSDGLELAGLNDGNGVDLRHGVADLEVTFRDGSEALQIEFFGQIKGPTQSSATTTAANGVDAQIQFTSVGVGEEFDGVKIEFVNDNQVTAGNETVTYNAVTKRLTFKIDEEHTRAADVIQALNDDPEASLFFTAATAGGDGTGLIDVSDTATTSGGAIENRNEQTLGDILETINAADPSRLKAQISADGDHIELLDLTSGGGEFSVTSLFGGTVAEDLGLDVPAADGVIQGSRRLAGLKTVLLSSLLGGSGFDPLGLLSLTDRSGASAGVDLSAAETLDDVIVAINAAGLGIQARINNARNGISLKDTSGGSGNLIVANGDATDTADQLGIAIDDQVASVNSGSLELQIVSRTTSLAALNDGEGVHAGSFTITDTKGKTAAINLKTTPAETLGDIIDQINGLDIGVEARINGAGDGLLFVDTANGGGKIRVTAVNGSTAADLRIEGESTSVELDGTPTEVIDGSTTLAISVDADDTLADLVSKINSEAGGISASLFNSGSGQTPFRLSLTSGIQGRSGELFVDGSQLGIEFQEIVAARDALLLVGSSNANVAGALARSSTGVFDEILEGVSLRVNGSSEQPVTVSVAQTEDSAVKQLKLFAEQYNKLQKKLDDLTFFNEDENSVGILFGSAETLQIEQDLANVLSSRVLGAGSIQSFATIGLSLDREGKVEFDEQKFRTAYAADPEAVQQFFTQADFGAADRIVAVGERLAGAGSSALLTRVEALQSSIEINEKRIADMDQLLIRERQALIEQFVQMETAIGRMQSSLTAIAQIQPLPLLIDSLRSR